MRILFKFLKIVCGFLKNRGMIIKYYEKKGGFKEVYDDFKRFKLINIKEFWGKNVSKFI